MTMIEEISQQSKNIQQDQTGITKISIAGFKSIVVQQDIEIKPLTILAGANSSGKSSLIQAVLLLKQTLAQSSSEFSLQLDGPNVKFTTIDQFLSKPANNASKLFIGLKVNGQTSLELTFGVSARPIKTLETQMMSYSDEGVNKSFQVGMSSEEILSQLPGSVSKLFNSGSMNPDEKWTIVRERCFLIPFLQQDSELGGLNVRPQAMREVETRVSDIIHISGIRGTPSRTYPLTYTGNNYAGNFESYVATLLSLQDNLSAKITKQLYSLGLASGLKVSRVNDREFEIQVGRIMDSSRTEEENRDLVNLADVGIGVSQILPVLVALEVAKSGQLVYIEQPEIHLHPKAQVGLARILADAAQRGVRLIVETHSELLLLSLQTLIAEGNLSADLVKLHWFSRDNRGVTKVTSADMNDEGSFGQWPQDFGSVNLKAQKNYLKAVASRYNPE